MKMDSATIKAVGRYGRAIPRTHLPLAIAMRGKPDIVDLVGYDDVGCIPCYVGIEPAILIAIDINDADRLNPTVFVYTTVDDRRDVYAFKRKEFVGTISGVTRDASSMDIRRIASDWSRGSRCHDTGRASRSPTTGLTIRGLPRSSEITSDFRMLHARWGPHSFRSPRMRTLAETLALAMAALLDALFGVGRFVRDVFAPPPSAAAAYDEATSLLQQAHQDIESVAEKPEPVASIARRLLSGDDTAPVWTLRPREQAWLGAARRYGLDVTNMNDDLLDAYVTGRWRAMRLAPAFPDETLQRVEGVLAVEPEVYARDLSFT